jgi:hypothetical protein
MVCRLTKPRKLIVAACRAAFLTPLDKRSIDNVGTTLAWVADDVPHGLVALCRLQCDQAGTSSKSESESLLSGTLPENDFAATGIDH